MTHNSKTAAHNSYLKGRQVQNDVPASETTAAPDLRLLSARTRILKAERTILELQTWILKEFATEEALLVNLMSECMGLWVGLSIFKSFSNFHKKPIILHIFWDMCVR
jgi:hypothetical protein